MKRTTQDRIAAFPRAIAVDLRKLACEAPFGIVKPGESGYQPLNPPLQRTTAMTLALLDEIVAGHFKTRKPTEAEREAALVGSMFGWDAPGADPAHYDADGKVRTETLPAAMPWGPAYYRRDND